MDFDRATQRLTKEQSKLPKGKLSANGWRSGGGTVLSAKAQREAAFQRERQERKLAEKKRQQQRIEHQRSVFRDCERKLGIREFPSSSSGLGDISSHEALFRPTSIHGNGDKIALPVSVLEHLTNAGIENTPGSPWTFRVAIPRPNYEFSTSQKFASLHPSADAADHMAVDDDGSDDDETDVADQLFGAYLDELSHKYIAYTHGTVVEFTQDEGHVGLPQLMAQSLLQQVSTTTNNSTVPIKRTVDPAGIASNASHDGGNTSMPEDDENKTPGHLAWGAFDVPDVGVEVSLIQLPKGRACTLTPTLAAVRNGFYDLRDVKLVLEQSLIRTRATLSLHDTVSTWHRGRQYDLTVTALTPAWYNAVLCINTDIEVEFGPAMGAKTSANGSAAALLPLAAGQSEPAVDVGGRRLNVEQNPKETAPVAGASNDKTTAIELKPEPPLEQVDGICNVQIRGDAGLQGRRRFDVTSHSVDDLVAFAASLRATAGQDGPFTLAMRFPRRVFTVDLSAQTLQQVGIEPGQQLFMIERC